MAYREMTLAELGTGSLLNLQLDHCQDAQAFATRTKDLSEPARQGPEPLIPDERRPVVIIGAGSIIHDGHGPAYRLAGLPIRAVYDRNLAQAEKVQSAFGAETLCTSLEEAIELGQASDAVFDIALPPDAVLDVVQRLPIGAGVLIQKPLGKNLEQARAIHAACRGRQLIAGINFQLPFSPQIVAAMQGYAMGLIGRLKRARVELDLFTQWSTWDFLLHEPRIEVLLHSIHYLSLYAFYLGAPLGLNSTQTGDPSHEVFKDRDICTETQLHYSTSHGPFVAEISCNHLSRKARSEWRSDLILIGEHGTIRAGINDNLDYPAGVADTLQIEHERFGSRAIPLVGNRFPWAFVATMTEVQRAVARARAAAPVAPANHLDFALLVMQLAEACYDSGARAGQRVTLASG